MSNMHVCNERSKVALASDLSPGVVVKLQVLSAMNKILFINTHTKEDQRSLVVIKAKAKG